VSSTFGEFHFWQSVQAPVAFVKDYEKERFRIFLQDSGDKNDFKKKDHKTYDVCLGCIIDPESERYINSNAR